MNLQISISKRQAEILEDLLLTNDSLTQEDFDILDGVQEQVTQLIENDEWES